MLTLSRRLGLRAALSNSFAFSSDYQHMKESLAKNLFSIELINKQVNRRILAMAYSPGVGAVCEAVEEDPKCADTMTLRARSIAILTDGSFLDSSPEGVGPALDWIISQVKYHSGYDPFPFIVDSDIDW